MTNNCMFKPEKTNEVKRVLELLDSEEDAHFRYKEFVDMVSNESKVSIEKLEKDLEFFI